MSADNDRAVSDLRRVHLRLTNMVMLAVDGLADEHQPRQELVEDLIAELTALVELIDHTSDAAAKPKRRKENNSSVTNIASGNAKVGIQVGQLRRDVHRR